MVPIDATSACTLCLLLAEQTRHYSSSCIP